MKAHVLRVTSEGGKLWGVRLDGHGPLADGEFIRVREEGPEIHQAGPWTPGGAPAAFWWVGTDLDPVPGRANWKKLW